MDPLDRSDVRDRVVAGCLEAILTGQTVTPKDVASLATFLGNIPAWDACLREAELNGYVAQTIVARLKDEHLRSNYDAKRDERIRRLTAALDACVAEEEVRQGSIRAAMAYEDFAAWQLGVIEGILRRDP